MSLKTPSSWKLSLEIKVVFKDFSYFLDFAPPNGDISVAVVKGDG